MEIIQAISGFLTLLLSAELIASVLLKLLSQSLFPAARIGLGLAAISFIITSLGFSGYLYSWLILAATLMLIAILLPKRLRDIARILREKSHGLRNMTAPKALPFLWLILFIIYLFFIFLNCLEPCIARDALNYHLLLPKLWLQKHHIFTLPENIYSFFPHFVNMLYAYALVLGNSQTAALTHLLFLLIAISAVIEILKLIYPGMQKRYLLCAAVILISTPSICMNAAQAYADIAALAYLLLAVYFLLRYQNGPSTFTLIVSALFLGCAAATKYQAAIWLILIPLWAITQKKHFKSRAAGLYLIIALLPITPFLLRNYAASGNPLFPLCNDLFKSHLLSAAQDAAYTNLAQSYGYGSSLLDLLLSPLRLTLRAAFDDPRGFDGVIGVIYLPLFFVFFSRNPARIHLKGIGFILTIYYLVWFTSSQQIRFLFFPLALLIIFAAEWLSRQKNIILILITGFIAINIFYPASRIWKHKTYDFLTGKENSRDFLRRNLAIYPVIEKANILCDPSKKILMLMTGTGGYYLSNPIFQEPLFEDYTTIKTLALGVTDFHGFLKNNNIGYILTHEKNIAIKMPSYAGEIIAQRYQAFKQRDLRLIYSHNGYAIYQINPQAPL